MPTDPSLAGLDEIEVPEQDTPETPVETEAPVEDTPTAHEVPDEIDWREEAQRLEKRYGDLRSEFDRRAQRDSERDERIRQYEEQLQALQSQPVAPPTRGYDDDDDEGFYEDPAQHPLIQQGLERVARIEAQLAQKAQQETLARQEALEHTYIDGELDRIESQLKRKLPAKASTWIGREALENRDPLTGQPDVEGAFRAYREILEDEKKQWVETKRSASAPAAGPGAVEVPDLDDPDQLDDYLDRAFRGASYD